MDNEKLNDLIALAKENNERQEKYRRTMLLLAKGISVGIGVLLIAVIAVVFVYAPKIGSVITRADAMLEESEIIIENAQKITDELAAIDIEETMSNVNVLVEQTSDGIGKSVETLDEVSQSIMKLDFEKLNDAIEDLAAVIEPLAKWFR